MVCLRGCVPKEQQGVKIRTLQPSHQTFFEGLPSNLTLMNFSDMITWMFRLYDFCHTATMNYVTNIERCLLSIVICSLSVHYICMSIQLFQISQAFQISLKCCSMMLEAVMCFVVCSCFGLVSEFKGLRVVSFYDF